MSTESETKSAGVPAGATHVCRFCNAYWRLHPESGKYERVEWFNGTGHYCVAADLVPIAEAGPAPTTAETPALPQARGKTCYSIRTTPAEQPGKADEGDHADDCTDPNCHKRHTIPAKRAALQGAVSLRQSREWLWKARIRIEILIDRMRGCDDEIKNGKRDKDGHSLSVDLEGPAWLEEHAAQLARIDAALPEQPGKAADPRPAQPQAPAEPNLRRRAEAAFLGVKQASTSNRAIDAIVEALTEVAAPLREERDKLASQLVGMTGERDDERKISQEWEEKAEAAEKAVAARDARIATLENELRGVLRHVEREAEEHAQAAIKIRAALGAPEGQRDYDPMTSPVPEGDMNGPHGPIPAPEGQPPAAPSEAPLRLEVRRLAEAFGKAGSEYERGGNTSGAAQLRRVSNLLYALWADGKAEVFTPFTCAEPEAPLDALREARGEIARLEQALSEANEDKLRIAEGRIAAQEQERREHKNEVARLAGQRDQARINHEDDVRARTAAIVHTIGGTVEGHPAHGGNYLQRLRELVAIEAAALSAPPPPPREQEPPGKEGVGADAVLQVLRDARDAIGDLAPGHTVMLDSLDEQIALREAAASAPPRKAPQEKTQNAIRQALRDLREVQEHAPPDEETGTALNAVEHRLLKLLPAGEPWPIPAPSPEEQLSGGETTKKEG